ncbi:MAG TPA: YqhA family protein [Acidobacteriaceae bacterium]
MDVNEKPVHSNVAAGSTNLPDTKIRAKKKSLPQIFEKTFESFLWSSRLAVSIAVLASVAVGLGLFYIATVDLPLRAITSYLNVPAEKHEDVRTQIVTQVVEAIDGYLLAAVMLIFALDYMSFSLAGLIVSKKMIGRVTLRSTAWMISNIGWAK